MRKEASQERALRRNLDLGEHLRVTFKPEGGPSLTGEIISLSEAGLAFLCDPHYGDDLVVGRSCELKIYCDARHSFQTQAEIRNILPFPAHGQFYLRVGLALRVKEPEVLKLDHKTILLETPSCGYVEIENPIFFDEIDHFRIRGIHEKGILLAPMGNRHFLLPDQPVQARFHIPGSRTFIAELQVVHQVLDHEWLNPLLLLRFADPTPAVLSKLAKFMLISEPSVSVRKLQDVGFPIPYLDFLLKVQYGPQGLMPESVAPLHRSFFTSYVKTVDPKQIRQIQFFRHDTLVATVCLHFAREAREGSAFRDRSIYGHPLQKKAVVELLDFTHHTDYPMASLLVPVLQQCLRLAIQAQFQYFVLECTLQTAPIFSRLGFRVISVSNEERCFTALNLRHGLSDLTQDVHRDTWERVYRRLHDFLHRRASPIRPAG